MTKLPWWRKILIEAGEVYLGWVLPLDETFTLTYQPAEKPWSLQVLEEDAKRKAANRRQRAS